MTISRTEFRNTIERLHISVQRAIAARDEQIHKLITIVIERNKEIKDLQETVSELVLLTGPTESKDN